MVVHLPTSTRSIVRTLRADHLNAVANDPDVRPWLGGDGVLDLSPIVSRPENLSFVTPHGGFICVGLGDGRYEAHSLFTPAGRGREALIAMRETAEYLFTASDAVELVTKVPETNHAAAGLARLAGFREAFRARVPWSAGATVMTHFLTLPLDRWAASSATAKTLGEWLHDTMDAAKAQAGSTLGAHSEDEEIHIRMAGAALAIGRAGNVTKAIRSYNRWATFAGYPLVTRLLEQPDVVDLGEGFIVELRGTEMEILQCP